VAGPRLLAGSRAVVMLRLRSRVGQIASQYAKASHTLDRRRVLGERCQIKQCSNWRLHGAGRKRDEKRAPWRRQVRVTIVVGNPKPRSRTARVAELLIQQVFGTAVSDLLVIDLADHTGELFVWPSARMAALNKRVAESDFALFASPTYKAAYTGLLKAFLDRYPANGLHGVAAVCLMTGAGTGHSLAPTTSLLPVVLELGASVPVRGLYFSTNQMDEMDEQIRVLAAELLEAMKALAPAVLSLARRGATA
jgi:FMN reductase